MSHTWVEYKQGSAVQEAIAMAKGLEAQGKTLIYMHQGAEDTNPSGILKESMIYAGEYGSKYNPAKGNAELIENIAHYAQRFYGLPADASNTFPITAQGRQFLGEAFKFANFEAVAQGKKAIMMAPRMRWPMVNNAAKYEHTKLDQTINYEVLRNGLVDETEKALSKAVEMESRGYALTAAYTNFPNNPTGYKSNKEEMHGVLNSLGEHNRHHGQEYGGVTLIDDNPYFMSLNQKREGSILEYPLEGIEKDGETPTIHVISFSKALATANGGFSFAVFTNSEMAKTYKNEYYPSHLGAAYDAKQAAGLAELFNARNFGAIQTYYAGLNEKYKTNFGFVQSNLGAHLVEGDPGMVCTIEVPKEALNKLVTCVDGVKREITSGRQVSEFIANTYGVVTVDQSDSQSAYMRLALKAEDAGQIEEGVQKIAQGFDDLINAPSI